MSSDLGTSATLTADSGFRGRVRAALTEHAATVLGQGPDPALSLTEQIISNRMACRIAADPAEQLVSAFARLVADNATASGVVDPALVSESDIRTVVQQMFAPVAATVPVL